MDDRFLIRAYWEARRETADECANRLLHFLMRIGGRTAVIATWYETARSRRKATEKTVSPSKDALLSLLQRGQNREDVTGKVIEDLGFHVSLWNGRSGREISGLSITCGLYSDVVGVGSNCVLIELPEELGELANGEVMAELFRDVIECWDPQRASVCSELAVDNRTFDANCPFVDWMVYVSELEIAATSVPDVAEVRHVGSGTMILVEDHATNALASEHLRKVEQVGNVIGGACA